MVPIETIAKTNFSNNWLTIERNSLALKVRPKDCGVWRWCKYIVQVLTFGLLRVYAHVRIDNVVRVMKALFRKETSFERKKLYLKVVNKLLNAKEPITTYRLKLIAFQKKLEKASDPSRRQLFY